MYLCDSNIWLSLALSAHLHHAPARDWLDSCDEPGSILFCRATQQTLVRLLSTAAVLAPYGNPPLTNHEAWQVYEAFVADERVGRVADEPPGVEGQWAAFAARPACSPKLWMDAYLAAFARAGGHALVTTDAAFSQFQGLDVRLIRP